jgi:hypothetical protein
MAKLTDMYLGLTLKQEILGEATADDDEGVKSKHGDNDHQDNNNDDGGNCWGS